MHGLLHTCIRAVSRRGAKCSQTDAGGVRAREREEEKRGAADESLFVGE